MALYLIKYICSILNISKMKRILLYGAAGRTGTQVLDYAIRRGYEVNALVRDASKITQKSPKINIITGLTTDTDDVRKAMIGCDAVICTLGALHQSEILTLRKIDPPHTLEISIRNTIECMKEAGIRRIITQSSFGVGDSYEYAPWLLKMAVKYTKFKIVVEDHNMQEQLLKASGLDWTIVQPVGLTDHTQFKKLCVTYDTAPPSRDVSRKQVAHFMIDNLENKAYLKKTPVLSEID
jgi:uncharacterized protein YbjT (DUF2867 family)